MRNIVCIAAVCAIIVLIAGCGPRHSDLQKGGEWALSIAFSPDGKILAGACRDSIKLWGVTAQKFIRTIDYTDELVYSVVFSPDGKLIAACGFKDKPDDPETGTPGGKETGFVRFFDAATGECVKVIQDEDFGFGSVTFSPDGALLAVAGDAGMIDLCDVASAKVIGKLEGHEKKYKVLDVAFSPDGKILASAGGDEMVKLWDVENRTCVATLKAHAMPVSHVVFTDDGKMLISGGQEGMIVLWDVVTKKCIKAFKSPYGVSGLAVSPNGKLIANSGVGQYIRLWDVPSRKLVREFQGSLYGTWALAFSPDGKLLASSSGVGIVRIWDME